MVDRDGTIVREVYHGGRVNYESFVSSGLCDRLTDRGLLVRHRELEPGRGADGVWRVLVPERVPFISYAPEWCPGQLRAAALATLDIQYEALQRGLSLKDAHPGNIQFLRGKPVLIDTLSFEPAGQAWVAYFQFCRRFLAPLSLAVHRGPELLRAAAWEQDGFPLPFVSRLLPRRTWLRPSLAVHLHLHARAEHRGAARARRPPAASAPSHAPAHSLNGGATVSAADISRQRALVDSLRRTVEALRWVPAETEWTRYEAAQPTYSPEAWQAREALLSAILDRVKPATAWDLGAALGHASRLAAKAGAATVAFDGDVSCVERMWEHVQASSDAHFLPLVQNLLSPTPRMGWAEEELHSLADRGPVDLLIVLGFLHHLTVRAGVPIALVLRYLKRLGRSACIEFVPPSDPIVTEWRARFRREPIEEADFRRAAGLEYTSVERLPIPGSGRVLYLCQ